MNKFQLVGVMIMVVTLGYGVTTTIINPVESTYALFDDESEEKEKDQIEMKVGHDERWMHTTVWGKPKEFVQTVSINPTKNVYSFHVTCIDTETEIIHQAVTVDGKVTEVKPNLKVQAVNNVCHFADNNL